MMAFEGVQVPAVGCQSEVASRVEEGYGYVAVDTGHVEMEPVVMQNCTAAEVRFETEEEMSVHPVADIAELVDMVNC